MNNGNDKKFGPHHLALLILTAIILGVLAKGCNEDRQPAPQETCTHYRNIEQCVPVQPSTMRTAIQGR